MRFYAIGCSPSSGSTIFARYLAALPYSIGGPEANIFNSESFFYFDGDFKKKALVNEYFKTNSIYSPKTKFLNMRHSQTFNINIQKRSELISKSNSISQFAEHFSQALSDAQGKSKVSSYFEKTPTNIGYIKYFLKFFPTGRFIVITRDGISTVISLIARGYSLHDAARIWTYQNWLALPFLDHPRVFFLKFEDFARNPLDSIERTLPELQIKQQIINNSELHAKVKDSNVIFPNISSWNFTSEIIDKSILDFTISNESIYQELMSLYFVEDEKKIKISFQETLELLGYAVSNQKIKLKYLPLKLDDLIPAKAGNNGA